MEKVINFKKLGSIETLSSREMLEEEFFPDITEDDYLCINSEEVYYESYPISIDNVIKYLNIIKEKGSTHVTLEYHVDHDTYIIEGFKHESEKEI